MMVPAKGNRAASYRDYASSQAPTDRHLAPGSITPNHRMADPGGVIDDISKLKG